MGDSDVRKVGALWRKTGKKGNTFYSGKLDAAAMKSALVGDETTLMLFPVKDKRGKGPDVELFCVPNRDTRESRHVPADEIGRSKPHDKPAASEFDDFGDLP